MREDLHCLTIGQNAVQCYRLLVFPKILGFVIRVWENRFIHEDLAFSNFTFQNTFSRIMKIVETTSHNEDRIKEYTEIYF